MTPLGTYALPSTARFACALLCSNCKGLAVMAGRGRWAVGQAGYILRIFWTPQHSPAIPFPLLQSPPIRPLPLEVGPLNPTRGSGERCKLPQRGLEPQPKSNSVHFRLKI